MGENTENKKEVKKDKPKKSNNTKNNIQIDKASLIFFGIMILGLIVFTIILVVQSNKTVYETSFGDIISTITISNSDIDIAINIDDNISEQHGTFERIEENNSEDTSDSEEDNENSNGKYKITLEVEEEKTEEIKMIIEDDTLTLIYSDGTEIMYKEKKDNE